jgi:hypothetical protein
MTAERYYYDFFGSRSESRWNVEKDIPWKEIDRELALSQPDILDKVRRTALIESYHAMGTVALIRLFHEDIDATSVFQVECFEGFRHFWSLRRYLDLVGFEPCITDEELVEIRRRNIEHVDYKPEDTIQQLVNFIWSEHAAGYFARQLGAQCREPVLAKLLGFISVDEFRHAEGGYQILARMLERRPELRPEVLRAASNFEHYGWRVCELPVAVENDFTTVLQLKRKFEKVCGARLTGEREVVHG